MQAESTVKRTTDLLEHDLFKLQLHPKEGVRAAQGGERNH